MDEAGLRHNDNHARLDGRVPGVWHRVGRTRECSALTQQVVEVAGIGCVQDLFDRRGGVWGCHLYPSYDEDRWATADLAGCQESHCLHTVLGSERALRPAVGMTRAVRDHVGRSEE